MFFGPAGKKNKPKKKKSSRIVLFQLKKNCLDDEFWCHPRLLTCLLYRRMSRYPSECSSWNMIPTVFITCLIPSNQLIVSSGEWFSFLSVKRLKMHFSKVEDTRSCSADCCSHAGCSSGSMAVLKAGDLQARRIPSKAKSPDLRPEGKDEELGQCPSPCWPTRVSCDNREIKWKLALWTLYEDSFWRNSWSHIHHSDPESLFVLFSVQSTLPLTYPQRQWGFLRVLKQQKAALSCLQNILKLQSANGAPAYSSLLI